MLFREEAAVPVAVHEAKNGHNAVPSRPLQAPGVLIFTAEYSSAGKRTQIHALRNLVGDIPPTSWRRNDLQTRRQARKWLSRWQRQGWLTWTGHKAVPPCQKKRKKR